MRIEAALLAVQVHSNGQRQIRQVVVRSVGGRVKEVYEGDPEPLVLVVLTMARQPYNIPYIVTLKFKLGSNYSLTCNNQIRN